MIKNTLYAKYLKERQDIDVLENKNGFITYKISGDECFIVDMCIDQEIRALGNARLFINELEKIAKEKSCKYISGNIHLWDKGANNTLIAALNIGFKVVKAEQGILVIVKEIGGV